MGMDINDAIIVTETLSKHKPILVDVMMLEELGLMENTDSPLKNGIVMFLAFFLFGAVPSNLFNNLHLVIPFIFGAIFSASG